MGFLRLRSWSCALQQDQRWSGSEGPLPKKDLPQKVAPFDEYYYPDGDFMVKVAFIGDWDQDGDGLDNFYESDCGCTYNNDLDSDNDGTDDGDEDSDGDGLTNFQEFVENTDMCDSDTDNDGLNDYAVHAGVCARVVGPLCVNRKPGFGGAAVF